MMWILRIWWDSLVRLTMNSAPINWNWVLLGHFISWRKLCFRIYRNIAWDALCIVWSSRLVRWLLQIKYLSLWIITRTSDDGWTGWRLDNDGMNMLFFLNNNTFSVTKRNIACTQSMDDVALDIIQWLCHWKHTRYNFGLSSPSLIVINEIMLLGPLCQLMWNSSLHLHLWLLRSTMRIWIQIWSIRQHIKQRKRQDPFSNHTTWYNLDWSETDTSTSEVMWR